MAKNKEKKSISITKYKSKREMNIGILLFAVIFIYLIITIFTYATSKRISIYEVREGSIVKDNSYIGLIRRNETVVSADAAGYVSYFQNENSKVKTGTSIYALSAEKLDTEAVIQETENTVVSEDAVKNVVLKVQNINQSFNTQKFSSIYSAKNEINTTLQNASNYTKTAQLGAVIAQNNANVTVYPSIRDGIVVMAIDGYEGWTEEQLNADSFDYGQYEVLHLKDQMEVMTGDPVYKLVTSEDWDVYIQLDKETAMELNDLTYIKTRIDKDNETIWADISIINKDGDYYACLSYDNSMIRYSGERYLNIELITEDQYGLKIPKSAVVEKEFYIVPEEYLTSSGSADGFLVQKNNSAEFKAASIYNVSEDGYLYLNPEDFEKDTVLVKPESTETYLLRTKHTLEGVYNINKGYAVFCQISILCENDEYYIVEEGMAYGLSNYDHIVQDGDTVVEEEVVFQ